MGWQFIPLFERCHGKIGLVSVTIIPTEHCRIHYMLTFSNPGMFESNFICVISEPLRHALYSGAAFKRVK